MQELLTPPTTVDPSLVFANVPQDPLEKQHAAMAEILPMFELDDETFNQAVADFVDQKVTELELESETNYVGYSGGGTENFIGPRTPMVVSGLLSREYYLNDNAAYTSSFRYTRDYYKRLLMKHPENPDKAYLNAVLQGANIGQAAYFGTWQAVDENARMDVTADIVSEDVPEASIADFKQNAACQERAGVAHNTLQIFGLTSRFEAGSISVKNEDDTVISEEHAFLSVQNINGTKLIFDPTNPKLVRDEKGKVINATASLYKMEDPQATMFTGSITESTRTNGINSKSRSREVTYTFRA